MFKILKVYVDIGEDIRVQKVVMKKYNFRFCTPLFSELLNVYMYICILTFSCKIWSKLYDKCMCTSKLAPRPLVYPYDIPKRAANVKTNRLGRNSGNYVVLSIMTGELCWSALKVKVVIG